jgi:hypothetical protein
VDATGRTAAAGIWVAGNAADVTVGVMQAAASGVIAAVAINADLTAEDTAAAVAARVGSLTPKHADWDRDTHKSGSAIVTRRQRNRRITRCG